MKTTDITIRNKVIYQIFTRNYKEGTFKAIENDLDRIKALGVDYIYLLPIHPSGEVNRKGSMGSPYAIKDYRAVDPVQGTLDDFISLTNAIHDKGMKIIIDVVYNHTSPDSVLSKEHPEWFYHKDNGDFGNRVGDWWDVIDLSYEDKGLWEYQIDTLKMWAKYVDGFRCDVAPMVPTEFWIEARKMVESVRPNCLWIAESVEPQFISLNRKAGVPTSSDSELYTAFDVCYDYDVYNPMKDAITGEGELKDYLALINLQESIYPENYIKLRSLENHDRPRAATLMPDSKILRNWTAFCYFAKGVTMLYAGQECLDAHHPTLFDLDPIKFDESKDISELLCKLSKIKKDPLFADSAFSVQAIGPNDSIIYAVHETRGTTKDNQRKAIGLFSTNGLPCSIVIDLENGIYKNEITGEDIDVFENTMPYNGEPVIIYL